MRSQRWEWTHTYGVHLLVFSIVAVVISGTGLVVVLSLGSDPDPPAPPPPSPSGSPTPSAAPISTADCVVGSWLAVELTDIGFTGTWTLIEGGPSFEYREDGTGLIDYGDRENGERGTLFEFEDDFFGGTTESVPSGQREFEYRLDGSSILHTYLNPLGGAQMESLPYNPSEDEFELECAGDSMAMVGEKGSVTLERQTP